MGELNFFPAAWLVPSLIPAAFVLLYSVLVRGFNVRHDWARRCGQCGYPRDIGVAICPECGVNHAEMIARERLWKSLMRAVAAFLVLATGLLTGLVCLPGNVLLDVWERLTVLQTVSVWTVLYIELATGTLIAGAAWFAIFTRRTWASGAIAAAAFCSGTLLLAGVLRYWVSL